MKFFDKIKKKLLCVNGFGIKKQESNVSIDYMFVDMKEKSSVDLLFLAQDASFMIRIAAKEELKNRGFFRYTLNHPFYNQTNRYA